MVSHCTFTQVGDGVWECRFVDVPVMSLPERARERANIRRKAREREPLDPNVKTFAERYPEVARIIAESEGDD